MNEIEVETISDLQTLLNKQTIINVEISDIDSSITLYFKEFKLVVDAFNIGHSPHLDIKAFKENI